MSHVLYLLSLAIHEPINYDFMALYSEKVDNLPQVTQPADDKARILTESAHSLPSSTPFCAPHRAKGATVGRGPWKQNWSSRDWSGYHSHLRGLVSSSILLKLGPK